MPFCKAISAKTQKPCRSYACKESDYCSSHRTQDTTCSECPICMNVIGGGYKIKYVVPVCGQSICLECIEKHMNIKRNNAKCPMCRRDYTVDEFKFIFPEKRAKRYDPLYSLMYSVMNNNLSPEDFHTMMGRMGVERAQEYVPNKLIKKSDKNKFYMPGHKQYERL